MISLKKNTLFFFALVIAIILFFGLTQEAKKPVHHEMVLQGTVVDIIKTYETVFEQRQYIQQELRISLPDATTHITISSNYILKQSPQLYEIGDHVLVGKVTDAKDNTYFLIGYDRTNILITLGVVFVAVVILVSRKQGLRSLLSMGFSFIVIIQFILPLIQAGYNPLFVSIAGVLLIIPITFGLTHGMNKKTLSAMAGTLVTLLITGMIATIVVHSSKLTGISSEEIETLFYTSDGLYNLSGLLIAGIVIGALGILDDVTISQASVVTELTNVTKKFSNKELFSRSMIVGRDHIASVVNTLILVYTGAFLSTLLLFLTFPRPFIVLINNETVVIQIVIALVGSIGLILAVPITTYIAIQLYSRIDGLQ